MCHIAIDLTFILSMLTFCLPLGFPQRGHRRRMCTLFALLQTFIVGMFCFLVCSVIFVCSIAGAACEVCKINNMQQDNLFKTNIATWTP